jgi:hypothetical protein
VKKGNLGWVWVSTRVGLIQSVSSVDTPGKICTFVMVEDVNQETVWTILSAVMCDMINSRWL